MSLLLFAQIKFKFWESFNEKSPHKRGDFQLYRIK